MGGGGGSVVEREGGKGVVVVVVLVKEGRTLGDDSRSLYCPLYSLASRTTPTVMTDFDKIFERRLRRHGVFSSCYKLWHVLFWKI